MIGETLGNYQIIASIGKGGMADVYLAEQVHISRPVAVKILPPELLRNPTFLERFRQEIKVITSLQHPHILSVYDVGVFGQSPYIVMAYMPGGSLADLIAQYPLGMPFHRVIRYIRESALALDSAHQEGIIHRDYKPSNVLLDKYANSYLADFGIARSADTTDQITGPDIIGTPGYMAPEMLSSGALTPSVDIYALGITLYQMLSGQLPFDADTPLGVLLAHMNSPVPDIRRLRPDLPDRVQTVIESALAKKPGDRYFNPLQLADATREALEGGAVRPSDQPSERGRTIQIPGLFRDGGGHLQAGEGTDPPPKRSPGPLLKVTGGLLLLLTLIMAGVLLLPGLVGGASLPTATPTAVASSQPSATAPPTLTEAAVEVSPTPTVNPALALAVTGVKANPEWSPYTADLNGAAMALVPAGCFMMGSSEGESDERPVHQVCFEVPFWIDVYEVSNREYGSAGNWSADDQPRDSLSKAQAAAYCEGRGARLPSEAEWEYAARGPDGLTYPWGDDFAADNVVFADNDPGGPAPVGSRPAGVSWIGAYDLSGNVWEWVSDWYALYPASPQVNPQGPDSGPREILRGGSWVYSAFDARASQRFGVDPGYRNMDAGFRCVQDWERG